MIPDDDYTAEHAKAGRYSTDYGTGWFVGIIATLAMLAIAYIVYSGNTNPVPSSMALERFKYTPGHLEFACEPGAGPVWEALQRDLELMRQREDDNTSVAILQNLQ